MLNEEVLSLLTGKLSRVNLVVFLFLVILELLNLFCLPLILLRGSMRYLVVLFIGLLALPIQASVKVDVFSSEIVLDDNQSDAEKNAKSQGLQQVIIKASGDKNAINSQVVKKALNKSSAYLSQIGYGDQFGQKSLKMIFNPPQIQSLLSQADLPYWSNIRSSLVVWVIQEGQYGREILWEHTSSSALNQIKFFSDLRGLPITVPVGDIEDVTSIAGPDLWGGFTAPISKASQRYMSDAVLVIRVQKAADGSYVRWTLYDEKPEFIVESKREPIVGSASGDTFKALEVAIDEVSNYYALKSSNKSSGVSDSMLTAQFVEVGSVQSFFALEKILKGLNSVAGVDVDKIVGNEVTFTIHLLGSEIDFESEVIQNNYIRRFEPEVLFIPKPNEDEVVPETDAVTNNVELMDNSVQENTVGELAEQDIGSAVPAIEDVAVNIPQEPKIAEVKPLYFEWVK